MNLYNWQEAAINALLTKGNGIVDACTGSGKTRVGIGVWTRLGGRLHVVVPTTYLQGQWAKELRALGLEVALHGGGHTDEMSDKANVWVLATARKHLTKHAQYGDVLVVDECHRTVATQARKIYDYDWHMVCGLSATTVGLKDLEKLIGPRVYSYTFEQAVADDVIRPVTVYNVAYDMEAQQLADYESETKEIENVSKELRRYGFTISAETVARIKSSNNEKVRKLGQLWTMLTANRKQSLYNHAQRVEIAERLIEDHADHNILIVSETIEPAASLADAFDSSNRYWSGINRKGRMTAIERFLGGVESPNVLFSAKCLVEGVDVPSIDMVLILSSSSSPRQFIQSIGRSVRRGTTPEALVFRLFTRGTVDTGAISALRQAKVLPSTRIKVVDDKLQPITIAERSLVSPEGTSHSIDADGKIFKTTKDGRRYYKDIPSDMGHAILKVKRKGGKFKQNQDGIVWVYSAQLKKWKDLGEWPLISDATVATPRNFFDPAPTADEIFGEIKRERMIF